MQNLNPAKNLRRVICGISCFRNSEQLRHFLHTKNIFDYEKPVGTDAWQCLVTDMMKQSLKAIVDREIVCLQAAITKQKVVVSYTLNHQRNYSI